MNCQASPSRYFSSRSLAPSQVGRKIYHQNSYFLMVSDDYFYAGMTIATSLVHGGPGPQFLSPVLFEALSSTPEPTFVAGQDIPDMDVRNYLEKEDHPNTANLSEPIQTLMQLAGTHKVIRNADDYRRIAEETAHWYIFGRTRAAFERKPDSLHGFPAARQMLLASPLCAHWTQRPYVGCQRLAKRSWHLPSVRTGPSDPARGPNGTPNAPWHFSNTCMGTSNSVRVPSGSPNAPWHLHCARTGHSDPTWGASGSPNGPWYLLSARTDTSDPTRGPSSSSNRPWHLPSPCTGPSDPARVPSGSLNVPWHLPSMRTGPSGTPNGPWHIPSTHMGTSDPARGPICSPNAPWHLPRTSTGTSDPVRGASALPNGPWHLSRDLSMVPLQHTHGQ
ncbi:UNVERIFIED_CONTAM: hypothetical protein FKN15_035906 [Acipenser sinensis]